MAWWGNIAGTALGYFRLGLSGVRLKNNAGDLLVRNTGDTADAAITASKANISGDVIDINSDAAGSGADWKYTIQRPATGMTAAVTLTLPVDDGTAEQGIKTDGAGVLSWANVAQLDVEQSWTQVQRTNELADNDASFDLDAAYLDFVCTLTAGATLTFTNIPATPVVQKGTILFVNGANYAVAAHANTKISTADLTRISATGTYMLFYRTSNGNVYVTTSASVTA